MDDDIDSLLKVSDVTRICRLKRSTVYSAVSRGLIPAVILWKGRHRRVVRFRKSDVEEWLRKRSTCAT